MILDNAGKKIERLLTVGWQKMTKPKTVADTIYGTILALSLLFCILYVFEQFVR